MKILKKSGCVLGAALVFLLPTVQGASANLLPGEENLLQVSADVTGNGVVDQVILAGRREEDQTARNLNIVVEDGATKEISRTALSGLSGLYPNLEIGDFNGDAVGDVMLTVSRRSRPALVCVAAFNETAPRVIFQSAGEEEALEVRGATAAITPADHRQTVRVKKGGTISLQLPENPTTGYRWRFVSSTGGKTVEFLGDENLVPDGSADMAGKPSLRVFSFLAKETGTLFMQLVNDRVWEGEASAIDHFETTVEIVDE